MDLFTYLMAKNGHNTSIHEDLFSYLLGKAQGGGGEIKTATGITINIPDAKKLVSFMMTKESTQATRILPSEYTQVDYIESNGNQFIDIGMIGNQDTKFELSIMPTSLSNVKHLLGNILTSDASISFNILNSTGAISRWGNDSITKASGLSVNTNYLLSISQNGYYVNGSLWWAPTINNFTTNGNLYLFTTNNSTSRYVGKLYYCKVYDNSTLVRNFIPCYRNSDNEVGLYDLVNNAFYTNQGTGAFTYGSVAQLPNPDYPQEVKTVKGYENLIGLGTQLNGYVDAGTLQFKIANLSIGYLFKTSDLPDQITFNAVGGNRANIAYFNQVPVLNTAAEARSASNSLPRTITVNKTYSYIHIQFSFNDSNVSNVQIVEGTTNLPYVPYGNNYIAVNVSDGNTTNSYPIPLNNNEIVGIGDYKDELLVDKTGHVYLNKKTRKQVYNGTESWTIEHLTGVPNNFYRNAPYSLGGQAIPMLNNIGRYSDKLNSFNYATFVSIGKNINFRCDEINNVADFQAMLSNQNMIIYYPLETSQLIDLQTTVDLKLFKGVNNVSNSEDGYMTIKYVSENEEA